MHGIKLACPHCGASLKVRKQPRANKEITCPRCADIFFGWEAIRSENAAMASDPTAGDSIRQEQASGRGGLLVLGAIAVGLLFLGVFGLGMHFLGTKEKPIAVVEPAEPTAATVFSETKKSLEASEVVARPASMPVPKDPVVPSARIPARPPETIALSPAAPRIPLADDSVSKPAAGRVAPMPAPAVPPSPVTPAAVPAPPPLGAAAPRAVAPGVTEEAIDRAIERGAEWLKRQQTPSGSWVLGGKYPIGYAALPGLTLLECKVPATDPHVQRAAAVVRAHAGKLDQTYELATTILFLDRLGDPRDRILIQACALRLVAGQTANLGWDYRCPPLDAHHMQLLLTYLEQTRPKVALPTTLPGSKEPLLTFIPTTNPSDRKPGDPFLTTIPDQKPDETSSRGPDQGVAIDPRQTPIPPEPVNGPSQGKATNPKDSPTADVPGTPSGKAETAVKGPEAKKEAPAKEGAAAKVSPKKALVRPDSLPPLLRAVPAVGGRGLTIRKGKGPMGRDDNSNSQFAMLALWAARRHGVATERALQLAHHRYRSTQNRDAGWGYRLGQTSTSAMTGVGMLGLGMGLGTAEALPGKAEVGPEGRHVRVRLDDPAMKFGLSRFAEWVGVPSPEGTVGDLENLYFLWTVERVAMLYNLRTIAGKDWYGWGAQNLLKHQTPEGNWFGSRYPGSTPVADTCLALLFLKRSNLVDDLSHSLQLYTVLPER